jgi:hypothetical protein
VLARGGAKTWHGTLTGTATALYHDAGGTSGPFTGTYRGTLTLAEDSAGGITGHAKVSASGCHIYNGKPSTSISFDVTGTDDGTQLRLRMISRSYRENGVSCGFGFGWTAPPPGESYLLHCRGHPDHGPGGRPGGLASDRQVSHRPLDGALPGRPGLRGMRHCGLAGCRGLAGGGGHGRCMLAMTLPAREVAHRAGGDG